MYMFLYGSYGSYAVYFPLTQQKCFVIVTYFYSNISKAFAPYLTPFSHAFLRPSKLLIKRTDDKSLVYATLKNEIQTIKI